MRRPHPRFDRRRNAWVTNAGGKLVTLAAGPYIAATETAAWDAFYRHMAQLGKPLPVAVAEITLGQLADQYGAWLVAEVAAGRKRPRTLDYYRHQLQRFLDAVGGQRPATSILPIELERFKTNWHSVQTVQRLYNWGCRMGIISMNPFTKIEKPQPGERKRVLAPVETARLLRAADHDFRPFLLLMLHTIARPQEIRSLQWKFFSASPVPMFMLIDFKGKQMRNDGVEHRPILLDSRMMRLLARIARRRPPEPNEFVLVNKLGKPWTANAVRCRMRRLREKLGLAADERGENVVAYTMRHTAATRATANGVRDRALADVMGHTQTTTTRRYQHLDVHHLLTVIDKANARRV